MDDPVITPNLMREYPGRIPDYAVEHVQGVGHWIVEERPELVLERLRAWL
jgi:pimeloyl-ACP methyl ester carboxylesterase